MSEDLQTNPRPSNSNVRRIIIYAVLLVVVFLAGLIPMWLRARTAASELAETEHRLTLATMQSNLASAAIDARRGDYEPARQSVSQFFTSLHAEIDRGNQSVYTAAQREAMQPLLAGRDDLITLLARSDPASADRLSDLFAAYRKTMNQSP